MGRLARLVARRPLAVLLAVAAVTLVALHGVVDLRTGAVRLDVDPSLDRLLSEDDEQRHFYDHARELFGSDEFVLLVLEGDDLFTPAHLETVRRVTDAVAGLDGVRRVLSIANATRIEAAGDEIVVEPFLATIPEDPAGLARLRAEVLSHPLYARSLVSADGGAAAVLVYFDRVSQRRFMEEALSDRVLALADAQRGDLKVWVTGAPHLKLELSRAVRRDLGRALPLILAIAAALFVLAFRSARGVLLPLVSIAIALVWTLGLMGWSGSALNVVSSLVPPLVLTLGFAASVHVIAEYYEGLRRAPVTDRAANRGTVEHAVREIGLAVGVNGLTTALGFGSLVASPVVAIRDFGTWAVVGVVAATVTSLTFLPATLALLGPARARATAGTEGAIDRLALRLAAFDERHRRLLLVGSVLGLALALLGASRLVVGSRFVTDFPADSSVRRGYEAVNQRMGGANAFYVVVEADADGAFTQPANLRALHALQQWLESQPEIGATASLADNVMLLNRAFHRGDSAAFTVPDSARLVKQLLLFGGDDVTRGFVDGQRRVANVVARSLVSDSLPVAHLMQRLDGRLAELPPGLHGRVTGDLVLLNDTVVQIARGQLQSIAGALLTIYLTLSLLLGSPWVGLVALLPNVLPIAIYFGSIGLLRIPLDPSTSMIGAIALGIAVDDTVHYFTRFNAESRRTGSQEGATASTLRAVIRPVTLTSAGLCLGFLTLTLGELGSQVRFGALCAFTLALAWLLDLTLSPALCAGLRMVTLWDLLAIDLGRDPQRQIPLFAGLSARQSRIFALMSDLVEVPRGLRLFTEGAHGDELFVVIAGELAASTERDGRRVDLSRSQRGDVVGEIALFHGTRTADVDVVADARLLRFDEADLERLARRYPRIATRVYRNLNRIIASRVVSTARALR